MSGLCVTAALATLALMAAPEKQTWESTLTPHVRADFLPRSALIEVDGQAQPERGLVQFDVTDPSRTFRIRVSAEGFEPAERVVEAGKIANGQFYVALRPAGFHGQIDTVDPSSMALAASALWKGGRIDDAADYAEQSLRAGQTPLANKVMGEVWRRRGDREKAVRYFTMYLSLTDNPSDGPEIRAWLLQEQPGDIKVPAR
jgi:hypothetical protein